MRCLASVSSFCWKRAICWNISCCIFLKALFITVSATPHPFYMWLFCLFRHCKLADVWRSPHSIFHCGFTSSHNTRRWSMERKEMAQILWKLQNPLTYSLHLSSFPVGAQYGSPLRTHYVKSIPFDTYPMPSSPALQLPANVGISYSTNRSILLCDERTDSCADTYCTPSAMLSLHH